MYYVPPLANYSLGLHNYKQTSNNNQFVKFVVRGVPFGCIVRFGLILLQAHRSIYKWDGRCQSVPVGKWELQVPPAISGTSLCKTQRSSCHQKSLHSGPATSHTIHCRSRIPPCTLVLSGWLAFATFTPCTKNIEFCY